MAVWESVDYGRFMVLEMIAGRNAEGSTCTVSNKSSEVQMTNHARCQQYIESNGARVSVEDARSGEL